MTGLRCLSKATLGVCFALAFLQSPGVSAFVVAPSLGSTARWCTNSATSTSTQASLSRGTQPIKASRRSRASVAGMSSLPTEVPSTATDAQERKVDPYVTELPDSFEDSVDRMGKATLQCMEEGQNLLRIDFDTSAGDETYTTLKSSLEMAKQLTKVLAEALISGDGEEGGAGERKGATLALFFPDAGSAALAKFEWGAGTDAAQVPDGVRFCTVKTEGPADSDVGCILLCPRNSEADFALELVKKVEAQGQFMVLVNPALINMGTTGYGLAGRRIRDEIISKFQTSYYLRTLPWGAVTKEHGKRYTVWQDDANDPSGYRLLKAVSERPLGEALDDIYNIANGLADDESTPEFLNSVAKFVRDFGRM